jgi:predicted AAA+ superfamily ATPase
MKKRIISLDIILARKSVFLFGPRQTGKSTWLLKNYPDALYINLLSKAVFDDYSMKPNALESDIELFKRKNNSNIIIIDEVQKLPTLLDEVHNQIEKNKSLRFILTGSSARKLKRHGANLLGGRASWRDMFPLVYPEIENQLKNQSDLEMRLLTGGLPSVFESTAPMDDLEDYVTLYLNEEIKSEGLVRQFEGFNRFLLTAALSNGKQVNFTEVGNDAQIPPRTVHDYFKILEDTLIGFMLEPFKKTISRKAVSTSKFYFFDTGVVNALLKRSLLKMGTPEAGDLFEHFVILEVRAYVSYKNKKVELNYWRSTSKLEVDLVISDKNFLIAIEIKSKSYLQPKDYKGLDALEEEFPEIKKIVVFNEGRQFIDTQKNIEFIPILSFLKMLWNGEIF